MNIIKGETAIVESTVYTDWQGSAARSAVANLTGATIKLYVKKRDGDSDANALFVKTGAVYDGLNGVARTTIAAADTNGLSYSSLYYEVVAKLVDGVTYIRTGVQPLKLLPNVGKTLF